MNTTSIGKLVLRAGLALIMLPHGFSKLQNLFSGDASFGDPIGIGPIPSLILSTFAEFFCSLLLLIGFKTRIAAGILIINMCVIGFIVHASDPWGVKELAFLFAVGFVSVAIFGAGKYSVDRN